MSSTASTILLRATMIAFVASSALMTVPLYASAPTWGSAISFGGGGADSGEAVKVDPDGNRYVTGAFSNTAYFPVQAGADSEGLSKLPAWAARRSLTSQGGSDIFLAKYDQLGQLLWLVQAGGPEDDHGFDLAFDSARNIYVTGLFTDSATFRGINGTEITVTGAGQTIFLAKYTPAGALAWVQTGASAAPADNEGYGVAVEPVSGSVYVAGRAQTATTFSSSNGTTHSVPGPGSWHMFLVRYNVAGIFQWGEWNEASPNSVAHKVAVDADNNSYVTGWMEGQTTFRSHDGHDVTVVGFSGPVQSGPDFPDDAYVVKYDENGDVKWVNHIGGYKAIATEIATSRYGRVSIIGFVGNVANSSQQASTIVTSQPPGNSVILGGGQLTAPYNADVFFATYDEAGVLLEARRFGGPQNEAGSGIAYDRHGHLVIEGIFQSTLDIGGRTLTGNAPTNLFVAEFAVNSNAQSCVPGDSSVDWTKEADGPGIEGFEGDPRIGLTPQGDVLVTGAYEPAAQFGAFRLQSLGMQDGFLALLKSDP